jgi:hypothetical protein
LIMPFGKFKGYDVETLPAAYLVWLAEKVELREPLRSAVMAAIGESIPERQVDKVTTVYRELAVKYHPDKGGHHLAMVAINEFYEKLRK